MGRNWFGIRLRPLPGTLLMAVSAGTALITAPDRAFAQSFFQQLFGTGSPSYAPPAHYLPPAGRPMSTPWVYSPTGRFGDDDRETGGRRGGSVRTVCVRMCDGYYFPISASTPRGSIHRDAQKCEQSCHGDARLFHMPASSVDIKDAVDTSGRNYTQLATAFLYRKRYIESCSCKPAPWSDASLARHRTYAVAEGRTAPAYRTEALEPPVVIAGAPRIPAETAIQDEAPSRQPPRIAREDASDPGRTEVATAAAVPVETPRPQILASATAASQIRRSGGAGPSQLAQPSFAPARRTAVLQPQAGFSAFGGAPKYTWPGDPPSRYR